MVKQLRPNGESEVQVRGGGYVPFTWVQDTKQTHKRHPEHRRGSCQSRCYWCRHVVASIEAKNNQKLGEPIGTPAPLTKCARRYQQDTTTFCRHSLRVRHCITANPVSTLTCDAYICTSCGAAASDVLEALKKAVLLDWGLAGWQDMHASISGVPLPHLRLQGLCC